MGTAWPTTAATGCLLTPGRLRVGSLPSTERPRASAFHTPHLSLLLPCGPRAFRNNAWNEAMCVQDGW